MVFPPRHLQAGSKKLFTLLTISSPHVELFIVLLEYCVDTGGSLVFRGVGERSLDTVKREYHLCTGTPIVGCHLSDVSYTQV